MNERQILSHIPALQRYAHGLTGSKTEGEALLISALEAVSAGRFGIDTGLPLRMALFEMLHRAWVPIDGPTDLPDQDGDALRLALTKLAPWDRAVLLLVRFEGFAVTEVASILHRSRTEVARRLADAERMLATRGLQRVLIIEDEMLAAMELEQLVVDLGCEVLGPVGSSGEAISLAAREKPDLILSDVELDGAASGLDAVREICRGGEVPVIFVTGYPDRVCDRRVADRSFLARKPLDRGQIAGFINAALSKSQAG